MLRRATLLSSLGALALVACGSASDRPAFVDDAATQPSPQPTTQPTTPPVSTGPTSPTGDASAPPPTDCKTTKPGDRCGVVPQCGCSTTETCDVIDAQGSVRCVAFGRAAMGRPCTATAGCAQGLTCIFGTCHAFCDNPGSACTQAGTGSCVQVTAQGGTAIPGFAVCMVDCQLQDPLACGGKTNAGIGECFVDDKGVTDCQEGGPQAENQSCSASAGCGPGLVCVTPSGSSNVCKRWCRVGTADCGGSVPCSGFSTKVMVGTVEYGACP